MSHIVIDRRKNDKGKSTVNRSRYMRRVKEAIKDSVRELIRDGTITDSLSNKDKTIKVKRRSLDQPDFHHSGEGGIKDIVLPGNKEFVVGDKFRRPKSGESESGSEAGTEETIDEFSFTISQQEFLDIFFEDLYLPDLVRKDMETIVEYQMKRAGFTVDGNPSRLNIIRSMRQSMSRNMALLSDEEEELERLEAVLACSKEHPTLSVISPDSYPVIEARIVELKEIIKSVPFIDDLDLRYNRWDKAPVPSTQAVVFGIMDVSGSMGEWEKDMAKRLFVLLLLFLQRKYETVKFVPIRHTTEAKEVSEEEFFLSKESGGTIISSAYDLMHDIQKERFPVANWNIFALQISDGDNSSSDVLFCVDTMQNTILPVCQYFAYIETKKQLADAAMISSLFGGILSGNKKVSDMYNAYYNLLVGKNKNFVTSVITDAADIYPVFRKLFEKKTS